MARLGEEAAHLLLRRRQRIVAASHGVRLLSGVGRWVRRAVQVGLRGAARLCGSDGRRRDRVPGGGVVRLTPRGEHVEQLGQPGPAAGAAGLDRSDRAVEHHRDLGDGVPLHVDQHQGGALVGGDAGQRREHLSTPLVVDRPVGGVRGRAGDQGSAVAVGVEVVGQRLGPAYLRGADPVEAGVDHDPVQPGGDRRLATERARPAEGSDQAVLQARRPRRRGCPSCAAPPPTAGHGAGRRGRRTRRCPRGRGPRAARRPSGRRPRVLGAGHPRTTTSATSPR